MIELLCIGFVVFCIFVAIKLNTIAKNSEPKPEPEPVKEEEPKDLSAKGVWMIVTVIAVVGLLSLLI